MKLRRRDPYNLLPALLACIATVGFLTLGLSSGVPRNFFGDDLLLLSASEGSELGNGYATSVFFGFNDVGSGKWRPAFTTLVPAFLQMFGENYLGYFLINSSLFLIVVFLTLRLLTQTFGVSSRVLIVIGIALTTSQFTWYSVWSPFGLMELGAMVFLLLALSSFARVSDGVDSMSGWLTASCIMVSACFHERYLIAVAPVAAISLCIRKRRGVLKVLAPWVTLVLSYVAIKVIVLKIDPLTGGGENDFRQTRGYWIVNHAWSSLRAIVGLGDGRIIGFGSGDESRIVVEGFVQQSLFLVNVVLFVGVSAALAVAWIRPGRLRESSVSNDDVMRWWIRVGILGVALALLIPASTVDSRIESRWLFGSHTLLIAFVGSLTVLRLQIVRDLSKPILVILVLSGAMAMQHRPEFETPMRDADRLIEIVKNNPQVASPWALMIRDPKSVGQWEWRLGYGDAFATLINPPSVITTSWDACVMTCIRVDMSQDNWIIREQSG